MYEVSCSVKQLLFLVFFLGMVNYLMAKIIEDATHQLQPIPGSIVCCDIYGVFTHTGIWLNGSVVELAGNGLVRNISPERFLQQRSGSQIFVMGSDSGEVLACEHAAAQAHSQIFEYLPYDVITNNCNRFVATCYGLPQPQDVTLFNELTDKLSNFFNKLIVFYPMKRL